MTYSSKIVLISWGVGNLLNSPVGSVSCTSSRIMSLHRSTHSSQINTDGPAISFFTSCWLLPLNEQYKSLLPPSSVFFLSLIGIYLVLHYLVLSLSCLISLRVTKISSTIPYFFAASALIK